MRNRVGLLPSFSIIGAGNLGTNLLHALVNHGYPLKSIFQKIKYPYYQSFIQFDLERVVRESDVIFICTQESRILEIVDQIAAVGDLGGKTFYHSANSLNAEVLVLLRERGGSIASFSPLQTFSGFCEEEDLFSGIYFLADGDESALEFARQICHDLNAHLLEVLSEDKIYYHIAAVSASNFLISILKLAEKQLSKVKGDGGEGLLGLKERLGVLFPLIRQTLKNVESNGVSASLTGPAARKESGVINRHLEYLDCEDAALYRALTKYLKS